MITLKLATVSRAFVGRCAAAAQQRADRPPHRRPAMDRTKRLRDLLVALLALGGASAALAGPPGDRVPPPAKPAAREAPDVRPLHARLRDRCLRRRGPRRQRR